VVFVTEVNTNIRVVLKEYVNSTTIGSVFSCRMGKNLSKKSRSCAQFSENKSVVSS